MGQQSRWTVHMDEMMLDVLKSSLELTYRIQRMTGLRVFPPVRRRAPHFSSGQRPTVWPFSSAKKKLPLGSLCFADDRTRTSTFLRRVDFESTASTNFATSACEQRGSISGKGGKVQEISSSMEVAESFVPGIDHFFVGFVVMADLDADVGIRVAIIEVAAFPF